MSKEAVIKTIKEYIALQEQTLVRVREQVRLFNLAIPRLEQEIEGEKARLSKLEAKEGEE